MLRFCDCCGSSMDCQQCDDPGVGAVWDRLMADLNSPGPHEHMCADCLAAGCNFTEPNGQGEHCQ